MIIVETSETTIILMMISKSSLKQSSFTEHDTNKNQGMLRNTLLDSNKFSEDSIQVPL